MTTEAIRIILADDHQLVRDSWKMLLENNTGIQVVATCDINEETIRTVGDLQPDLVLVDINMASPLKGLGMAESLISKLAARVIGLSVSNHPKYALKLLSLGGRGFLTKTSTLEEVYRGIHEVHRGHVFISAEVKARMSEAERARL